MAMDARFNMIWTEQCKKEQKLQTLISLGQDRASMDRKNTLSLRRATMGSSGDVTMRSPPRSGSLPSLTVRPESSRSGSSGRSAGTPPSRSGSTGDLAPAKFDWSSWRSKITCL
eukprot:TRINITY_DN50016_c0_g1_i1.p2 TRINITY_DN50016_c0_g1~~TRINITY_DN50016_c0_g1_i1.p2  ORF type:complete len:114 (+),score=24.27 TRINITY_DN50016_c0_g1_i1:93-434(+)